MTRTERQLKGIDLWKKNDCKGSLVYCTGAGKTNTALMAAERVLSKNPKITIIVIVPTEALKSQWEENIEKRQIEGNISVKIINTACETPFNCDFLILDECHLYNSSHFSEIFNQCSPRFILGLSATYERLDGREKEIMDKYCPPCDYITTKEAIENGWLSPYKEYKVLLDVDLTEYDKANMEFMNHFSFFDYKFDVAMNAVTNIFFQQKYAKQINCDLKEVKAHAYSFMRSLQFRKKFISNHPKKIEIANKIIESRSNKKIITFNSSIENCKKYGNGYILHSKQKDDVNKQILEEFSHCNNGVIHSAKMIDAGYDCPDVSVAIITGFNSSKITSVQRIGRTLRFVPNKYAEIFTLVLKGTVEEKWFSKSREGMDFISITESELYEVLKGNSIEEQVITQDKFNLFRY